MRKAFGGGVLGVVVLLVGCAHGQDVDPGPVMTVIPTVAAEGADMVCGMDRVDLETAMGLTVGRFEDGLGVQDGVGSGECTVWPENESLVNGPLLWVTFFAVSSPDGIEWRARVDGGDGFRAPDAPFESLDGGAWGDLEEPGHMTLGATSAVFWGETVIMFTTSRGEVDRDHAADLVALTRQVADSYGLDGLDGPEGTS
jgi:hypothetical protein